MPKHSGILNIINNMNRDKKEFLKSSFLSPIVNTGSVLVQINGFVYTLSVQGGSVAGWKILEPISETKAVVVRDSSYVERDEYLSCLKKLHFIAMYSDEGVLYGYPAGHADTRFGAVDITSIFLADLDLVNTFDHVIVRFDGVNCWFDDIDFSYNTQKSDAIRGYLDSFIEIDKVKVSGMTPHEKVVYNIMWNHKKEHEKSWMEIRLSRMVSHAQGEFVSYEETSYSYSVVYKIDNIIQPTAVINKDNFSVISSGVCLNDGAFDLSTLVSAMNERQRLGGNSDVYAWHRDGEY